MYATTSFVLDGHDMPETTQQGPDAAPLSAVYFTSQQGECGRAHNMIVAHDSMLAAARLARALIASLDGFAERGVALTPETVQTLDDIRLTAHRLTYAGVDA